MKFNKKVFITLCLFSLNAYSFDQDCSHINKYGKITSEVNYFNICREGYSIGYNFSTKTPAWVAEHLTRNSLDGEDLSRTNNFRPDPLVPTQYSASEDDYRDSGYDRGHMSPADDFRNSETEMSDSFYFSNVVPQNSNLNRGTWGIIEKNVRYLAKEYDEVMVVTGPIYYNGKSLGYAGTVPVPTHLFKAIYIPRTNQAISFIMPNVAVEPSQIMNSRSSIYNLEKLTGLNIFPDIDDDVKQTFPSDLVFFEN